MSNQVYRNDQDSKYSPSKLVNRMELQGANQILSASYSPQSIIFNKVNGVNINPTAGVTNYLPVILPGSEDVVPIYNIANLPYTYFKIMKSGTYTINITFAMNGFTGVNRMFGVGIAICDKGTLTPQVPIRNLSCQWSGSSGVINPGPYAISASYVGYLEADQTFFPCLISTDGVEVIYGVTTHGQTTILEYFKN